MKVTIKTETLQNLVNKVVKGMGNNKMLPITEMIGINISDSTLSLVSTDGMNKVQTYCTLEQPVTETIDIAVNGNSFSKLIQKTTSTNTTLTVENNKLTVKGNGSYTFSLPVDEDNNLVKLETITVDGLEKQEIDVKLLKQTSLINKDSVATTMEFPAYTGYYYDNNGAVSTNSLKISYVKTILFNNPVLLYPSFVNLFQLFDDDGKVNTYQSNSGITMQTKDVIIQGQKMPELSDFPINDIKPYLEQQMPHQVRVNKQALLDLLERISVFVTPYDKNGIKVDFTKDGLLVWTINGANNELLPYSGNEKQEDGSIKIDVTNFKTMVASNPGEEVIISYGDPNAIKISFGTVTQVVSLQSEE